MKKIKNPRMRIPVAGRSCLGVLLGLAVFLLLWAVLLPGLWPMTWFLSGIYTNPLAFVIPLVFLALAGWLATTRQGWLVQPLAILFVVVWVGWLILSRPLMLVELYNRTTYTPVDTLIPLASSRPVSYAEAHENFKNQNPDTRFAPGDLDYVHGRWIAEFGPNNPFDLINRLIYPSQGFFLYDPTSVDKVQIVRQKMPFAENGLLWNSAEFYVRQHDAFSEFHEVLYVADPQGGYMGVISLIKRSGWQRAPYVAEVGLFHAKGRAEWLSPAQAEADPRLDGLQLEPEWLAARKTEAYGWRNGLLAGLITRQGRVSVQRSSINEENSAPYHLETVQGMMWFTPFGPYRKDSLKGILMAQSNDLDGPVFVWELPGDQAYQGVDALATEIKAAPSHPADVNWLRVSRGEDSEVRSGDTDVIELLPAPRLENGPDGEKVTLYFTGFVAIDPPTRTRFYTIINAETREVLNDVYSADQINAWMRGEIEIPVQTKDGQARVYTAGTGSLEEMSEAELYDLMQAIVEELKRR